MTEALAAALTALALAVAGYLRDLHERRLRQAGDKRTRSTDLGENDRPD